MPACSRHHFIAASGSSQVENATAGLPCLRREKRSSSAAAMVTPSTTSAAAGSWKTALIPSTAVTAPPPGSGPRRLLAWADQQLADFTALRLVEGEQHGAGDERRVVEL